MTATHDPNSTLPTAPVLSFSLQLGWNTWSSCLAKHIGEDSISLRAFGLIDPKPFSANAPGVFQALFWGPHDPCSSVQKVKHRTGGHHRTLDLDRLRWRPTLKPAEPFCGAAEDGRFLESRAQVGPRP